MHDRTEQSVHDGRVFTPPQLRGVGPDYHIEISSKNVVVFAVKIDMLRNSHLLRLKCPRTFENQLHILFFLHALSPFLPLPKKALFAPQKRGVGPNPLPAKEGPQDKQLIGEEANKLGRAGGEILTFKMLCLSHFLHKSDENIQNYLVKENTHASLFCTLLL